MSNGDLVRYAWKMYHSARMVVAAIAATKSVSAML